MKKMPVSIKHKLRRLQKVSRESKDIMQSLKKDFEKFNLDLDDFSSQGKGDYQTEALTFITYAEGDIEDNIEEIEDVFLYYINKELTR